MLRAIVIAAAFCCPAAAEAATSPGFILASPTFRSGAEMPLPNVDNRDGCKGSNMSPPLVWLHAPAGTSSYAITMADLDAKVGVVWLWLMFGIPGTTTALPQNADGDAALRPHGALQSRNGFGTMGYQGPCPRRGSAAHHYLITVWALDQAPLPFKAGAPAQTVAVYLRRHAVAHASMTPSYSRH